ncbi:hypothetical protein BDN72DRAFT_897203 [Pluteus cervinus]|uniref:Uncharacterized protein n=1 Tax=Pluteus cervinus TaxID=181527 RepID=A0ACD3AVE5_9AGAR|nr:hypothetical protein BDN72DRAFT_897203 [Pluteus cervinus]
MASSHEIAPVAIIFSLLQTISLVALLAVLIPSILSKSVKRLATWYFFMFSWVAYTISFLLFSWRHRDYKPPLAGCFLQAILIYAVPAASSTAGLCFVLELYLHIRRSILGIGMSKWARTLLFAAPFCVLNFVIIFSFTMGILHPSEIEMIEGAVYCHIRSATPSLVTALISFATNLTAIIVLVIIAVMVYRPWKVVKSESVSLTPTITWSIVIRVSIFACLPLIVLIVGLPLVFSTPDSASSDRWTSLLAILPLTVALIFGTQRDILSVYAFWRRREVKA